MFKENIKYQKYQVKVQTSTPLGCCGRILRELWRKVSNIIKLKCCKVKWARILPKTDLKLLQKIFCFKLLLNVILKCVTALLDVLMFFILFLNVTLFFLPRTTSWNWKGFFLFCFVYCCWVGFLVFFLWPNVICLFIEIEADHTIAF